MGRLSVIVVVFVALAVVAGSTDCQPCEHYDGFLSNAAVCPPGTPSNNFTVTVGSTSENLTVSYSSRTITCTRCDAIFLTVTNDYGSAGKQQLQNGVTGVRLSINNISEQCSNTTVNKPQVTFSVPGPIQNGTTLDVASSYPGGVNCPVPQASFKVVQSMALPARTAQGESPSQPVTNSSDALTTSKDSSSNGAANATSVSVTVIAAAVIIAVVV